MIFDKDIFGESVSKCRIKLNLTQEELAEKANLSPAHLGKLERGFYSPSAIAVNDILNALGISYNECINGQLSEDDLLYKSILTLYHSSELSPANKKFIMNMLSALNERCNS